MAETIYTKDGKCHTLLGSTTPVSIIREYCGDDLASWAYKLLSENEQTVGRVSRVRDLEEALEEANNALNLASYEIEYLNNKIKGEM